MDQSARRLERMELTMQENGVEMSWHLNPLKMAQEGWVVTYRETESSLQNSEGKVTEMLVEHTVRWCKKVPWVPPEQRGELTREETPKVTT